MDPQVAWDRLQETYHAHDWEAAREWAEALLAWLARGGFPPMTYADACDDSARRRVFVEDFCRCVLRQEVES